MFPNLEDYDRNDFRQIGLYAWNFDFYALKQLIDFNNTTLNQEIHNLCDESIKANENNEFKKHSELMSEIMSYHKVGPWMFQSAFLSLYSVVEAALNSYCDMCHDEFNLNLKKESYKSDKGIFRAVKYLEKEVKVENIISDDKWIKMTILNKLRNDMIHSSGIVTNSKKIHLYKSELDIEIVDGKIYLTYENMISIYDQIEEFMNFIFSRDCKDKSKNFRIVEA